MVKALGLVFFANHFRIAHTAYEAFMKSIGCGVDQIIKASDYLLPVVHAEADYKKGLSLGDALAISLKASLRETSFSLSYTFKDSQGDVAATVTTVHVSIEKESGKKIPLPEAIRQGLATIS